MTIDGLRRVLTVVAVVAVSGSVAGSTQAVPSDVALVQDPSEFEVASIRPTKDNRSRGLIDASIEAELVRAVFGGAPRKRPEIQNDRTVSPRAHSAGI